MTSKRPWKKYAKIARLERNNGDVVFETSTHPHTVGHEALWDVRGQFQTLTEAEADLDAWWAAWWPLRIKSRSPA